MNNAIVESYTGTGIRLYALPYIEAGRQKEAIPTYVASTDVMNLMGNNLIFLKKHKHIMLIQFQELLDIELVQ